MIYRFGDFELDAHCFELRCGGALLDAEPRVLHFLLHLVRNRERLVPREELLAEVWAGVHVEEASLYRAVAIARRLLAQRESANEPIRTVRGRGYRFVAAVRVLEPALARPASGSDLPGRAGQLATLAAALERARAGERQLVVVSGEAGLGKTRLVEAFLAALRQDGDVETATGQCLVPFKGGEPYSPLLEALARLCRHTGAHAVEALRNRAPAWLAQLPGHTDPAARGLFESRARGATRERLTEELADALDEIASRRPLVLVLEDLHACDRATLGLLAALAQRPEAAALLVVGTARTGDPANAAGPLWRLVGELKGKGRCQELALSPLGEPDVAEVARARLAGAEPEEDLVRWLARRSAGNPLYVHHLIDFFLEGKGGVPSDVPESLAELIERQVEALEPSAIRLLEAASAAGLEFSAAEAAAALDAELVPIEEACDELARRSLFLVRAGIADWPDGTLAARFRFAHALHRDVLAERVPPARRRALHLRLAQRLERGLGERARELAGALADHFEQGGDAEGAVRHYRVAVGAAARRHAGHEARCLAERAFALLPKLTEPERSDAELALRFALVPVLPEAIGFADPAVEQNLARAQELCEAAGDAERRLAVLWSRCHASYQAGESDQALALAEQLLAAARACGHPAFEVLAHDALAFSCHKLCRFEDSEAHAERVLALYDAERHAELAEWIGQDVVVDASITSAFNLWYLGRPAEAVRRIGQAVEAARRSGHGYSLVLALCYAATFHVIAEDPARAREAAEQAILHAREERLPGHRAFGELMRASALPPEQGRLGAMLAALQIAPASERQTLRATGTTGVRALFASALAEAGLRDLALAQIAEAFADVGRSGERHQVPGLHLLRASLTQDDAQAEAELEQSLKVASELGNRMAELQAATELARLHLRWGRRGEACDLLAQRVTEMRHEPGVPVLERARAVLLARTAPDAP